MIDQELFVGVLSVVLPYLLIGWVLASVGLVSWVVLVFTVPIFVFILLAIEAVSR